MEDMEKLVIQTRNSLYEIIIIDGRRGEILVRGGQFFPELTPARLAGATLGGSFCKMRGIYTGFRMEINANGKRTVTTPVESIGVLAQGLQIFRTILGGQACDPKIFHIAHNSSHSV